MTHITTEVDEEPITEVAYNLGVEDIITFSGDEIHRSNVYLVFLNGNRINFCIERNLISIISNSWSNF